jgi:hypothetical protein
METIQDPALWLEALSDKVLHQLPPAVWKQLFLGEGHESIRFEQRHLTLVHADSQAEPGRPGGATERFYRELQRINTRYHGRLDPYVDAAALIAFDDPSAAVRMAIELQQAAQDIALRIGVVSGPCTLAFFRAQGRLWCTPLGVQPARAAQVAASASAGGIVISPETYAPLGIEVRGEALRGGRDFEDSELDLSTLSGADSGSIPVDIDIDALAAH